MSGSSTIEWTDATWNPVTGCTKVSPGCDHCYAERITERFHGKGSFEHVVLHRERLDAPSRWHRPRRVFVNSMSDLFHVNVPEEFVCEVLSVCAQNRQHVFQILTKRAERLERLIRGGYERNPLLDLQNVWFGVSVESSTYYARVRHLQRVPDHAAGYDRHPGTVRFLSCEPLLAPLPDLPLDGIGWVIVGGESGAGARPMQADWVRDIRDQCERADVAFFFKQAGAVLGREWGCSTSHGNDMDAWPEDLRIRQYPT